MVIKQFFLFLISIFFVSVLHADVKSDLKDSFLKNIDAVIDVVKDKNITKEDRHSKVISILTPMFDFELMAKLSLGKVWNKMSKDDKDKFVKLYVERMKKSYSSKIDSYSDEKVEVKNILEPKKNRLTLETDIISSAKSLEVVYKFYEPKKRKEKKDLWLIYDVEIIGVSILKADKAQFKEFLKTKSISELMDSLAKQ